MTTNVSFNGRVVWSALLAGCVVITGLAGIGCNLSPRKINENPRILIKYLEELEGRELRVLPISDRENIALYLDRLRGVEFSPAYLCRLRPANEDVLYLVAVEAPFVDSIPPLGMLRISVIDIASDRLQSPVSSSVFGTSGTLCRVDVLRRQESMKNVGDLLVLTVGRLRRGYMREIYTLVSGRPKLIRIEDEKGVLIPAGRGAYYDSCSKLSLDRCDGKTDWASLCRPSATSDLLAALVYITSVEYSKNTLLSDDERNIVSSKMVLSKSEAFDVLRRHDNLWVREYAAVLAGSGEHKQSGGSEESEMGSDLRILQMK